MAHLPHRRTLASSPPNPNPNPNPSSPMDPISRKQLSSSFTTTNHHRRHPDPATTHHRKNPDPTTTTHHRKNPDPPTIQNISNHFTNLQISHKLHSSIKPTSTFQEPKSKSDSSSTSLTKSKSLTRRNLSGFQRSTTEKKKVPAFNEEEQDIKREVIKTEEFKKIKESVDDDDDDDDVKRSSLCKSMVVVGSDRRRSFGCTKTELADFFSRNGVKVVSVDMPPFMQIHAVDFARKSCDSLEKFTARTLASTLKKEFDGVYGPAWHCIVGTSFGSFVTHSVGGFLYFSMDHKQYVLLFKTAVQRAQD